MSEREDDAGAMAETADEDEARGEGRLGSAERIGARGGGARGP